MLWLLFVPERNMWWFRGVFAVSTHDRDVSTFGAWLSTRWPVLSTAPAGVVSDLSTPAKRTGVLFWQAFHRGSS